MTDKEKREQLGVCDRHKGYEPHSFYNDMTDHSCQNWRPIEASAMSKNRQEAFEIAEQVTSDKDFMPNVDMLMVCQELLALKREVAAAEHRDAEIGAAYERAADEADGAQREAKWFKEETRKPQEIYNQAVCEVADYIRKLATPSQLTALEEVKRQVRLESENLAMIIRRLCRKHPSKDLVAKAKAYLKKIGLDGQLLREVDADGEPITLELRAAVEPPAVGKASLKGENKE